MMETAPFLNKDADPNEFYYIADEFPPLLTTTTATR
jgi:hypothetical protein